jgi:ornithine carbamoyltransferase
VRDLVSDRHLSTRDIHAIFSLAEDVKSNPRAYAQALAGKQLALIFEKPSLRTRVSFEVGITSLGGHAVYLEHAKPRLGERECIKDIARNLERWVDGIAARTYSQASVEELAEHASIPVINALTDLYHPCQALADLFTLSERLDTLAGVKIAYVGDGNNVCHSLMMIAAKLGVSLAIATPPGFEPKLDVLHEAQSCALEQGATIDIVHDPFEAATQAQAIYTDVWASMGQEHAAHLRAQIFATYRVTSELMAAAEPGAFFMHCLPAHRGQEVTDEVIDGPSSIVYDQAENRLHVQKSLLLLLTQGQRQRPSVRGRKEKTLAF